ncbi:MAG: hypothetical protein LBP22_00255 [Deltaproteobacteria bacterium]|nr:hypothetical protein [Deltaproteobacteria bacterium]
MAAENNADPVNALNVLTAGQAAETAYGGSDVSRPIKPEAVLYVREGEYLWFCENRPALGEEGCQRYLNRWLAGSSRPE